MQRSDNQPIIIFVDLFCGAGGVTTGAVKARMGKYQPVKVIAAINHDPLAIESHEYNHSETLHFSEDVRTLNLFDLVRLVEFNRRKYPNCIIVLWASLECTNYSKAKGGMPRDADSRSLPIHMYRYIKELDVDYFYYENVEEFMSWGPLDENGRPISRKNGRDYLKWVSTIEKMGYRHHRRIINSADFGAHTKRKRLFGIFAKDDLPIVWPDPTHAESPDDDNMFGAKKKWNPVREVLDFDNEGNSVFTRKKPLVENTMKRIYAGLQKYVANGDGFLMKYYGTGDNVESLDKPCGTIRTKDCFKKVQAVWLDKGFSGVHNHQSINTPAGSIPTKDHYSKVSAHFLDKQYGGELNHQSVNTPSGSILANDKHCKVTAHFLDRQFSNGTRHESVSSPAGAILTVPKMNLVSCKGAFLMNPQFSSKGGSVDDPCFTLIARMDKKPPSLVQAKSAWLMNHTYSNPGSSVDDPAPTLLASRRHYYLNQAVTGKDLPKYLKIKKSDTPSMKKVKKFCKKYGIIDILTRMLEVDELMRIQGFPDDYYLAGNKTDQKKFIGNSVPPIVPQRLMESLAQQIEKIMRIAA